MVLRATAASEIADTKDWSALSTSVYELSNSDTPDTLYNYGKESQD